MYAALSSSDNKFVSLLEVVRVVRILALIPIVFFFVVIKRSGPLVQKKILKRHIVQDLVELVRGEILLETEDYCPD